MEEVISKRLSVIRRYNTIFIKWVLISAFTGIVGGTVGSLFHLSVEWATEYRINHGNILYFLPFAGLAIIFLYNLSHAHNEAGTNLVIDSVRKDGEVPTSMAPLIFISTVITQLFGGSAGREGAALQLGGSIGDRKSVV